MIPDPTATTAPTPATPAPAPATPAPAASSSSSSSVVAPHVLLGIVLVLIVAAIAILAGLHDTVPVVLQALGIADAGALGVAVPAG